jgi:hypothetical protein
VDRDAVLDVGVLEHDLDEIPLADAELGPRRRPVERQRVDDAARGEPDVGLARDEPEARVRPPSRPPQARHARPAVVVLVRRPERRPAAVVGPRVVHRVVGPGKAALVPGPRAEGEHRDADDGAEGDQELLHGAPQDASILGSRQ